MSSKQTVGIDTAKRVFFLHGEDVRGEVILREKLTRERLLPFLANQPLSRTITNSARHEKPVICNDFHGYRFTRSSIT
jgi:hypothetical protein